MQAQTLQDLVTEPCDGGPYARALVEDALAIVVLTAPRAPGEPAPEVLRLIGSFAVRAGVSPECTAAERQRLITARMTALTFPEPLVEAIARLVLASSDRGRSEAIMRFSAFSGEARAIEPKRPPKANQVTGGQLARISIDATLEASLSKKKDPRP